MTRQKFIGVLVIFVTIIYILRSTYYWGKNNQSKIFVKYPVPFSTKSLTINYDTNQLYSQNKTPDQNESNNKAKFFDCFGSTLLFSLTAVTPFSISAGKLGIIFTIDSSFPIISSSLFILIPASIETKVTFFLESALSFNLISSQSGQP